MKYLLYMLSLSLLLLSCSSKQKGQIKIQWVDQLWVDQLNGDYSFIDRWDYEESLTDDMPTDTTRHYYTIACEANCYEWAGTNYMMAEMVGNDTVVCYTMGNVATHCSLHMILVGENCTPTVELISIVAEGNTTFVCNGGHLKIDRKLWTVGIMKAEFSFTFDNPSDPNFPIWWKGRIFTRIKENGIQEDFRGCLNFPQENN